MAGNGGDVWKQPAERKAAPVLEALDECYGRKSLGDPEDPLAVLVRGILSQNTSDVNSGRAYRELMDRFGDWEGLAGASPSQIEETIRSGGLAEQKSRSIKAVMDWLSDRDRYSLDFLADMDSREAEAELTRIRGVGVKTARLVLLFGLGRPVFVVDTHVHRVSRRLGLIPENANRRKAHDLLDDLIPDEDKYSGHLNLIQHGRRTCRARNPLCDECCVRGWCLYIQGALE